MFVSFSFLDKLYFNINEFMFCHIPLPVGCVILKQKTLLILIALFIVYFNVILYNTDSSSSGCLTGSWSVWSHAVTPHSTIYHLVFVI